VRTDKGDVVRARFVIAAVGALSAANIPPFKGLSSFKGKCYHTSQWPHDGVDFTAKRVGVIGSGATAVQAIPEIAQQAKHLTVFQRTPTFCVPARNGRVDPEVTKARKADYDGVRERIKDSFFGFELNFIPKSVLDTTPEEREQEFDKMWDTGGFAFWLANYQDMFFSKEANDVIADYLRRKIRSTVNDPAIAEKLTPKTYPYGTKRQPLDTNYFETFNKKNVVLVDASADGPIEEITPKGIRAGGREYPLDIIVIATGFDALTGSLKKLDIKGRGGRTLAQEWEDGPQTYLGLAIAGYPNLFTITGPQSPSVLSNVPVSIEQHVEWITECIAHMRRNKLATIEASPQAQDAWGAHVAEVVNSTLMPGANSWYMGANIAGKARRFLPYLGPEGVGGYRRKCAEVAEKGYEGFVFASRGQGGTVHTIAAE
jgi:cyclohexanone monooxygenase